MPCRVRPGDFSWKHAGNSPTSSSRPKSPSRPATRPAEESMMRGKRREGACVIALCRRSRICRDGTRAAAGVFVFLVALAAPIVIASPAGATPTPPQLPVPTVPTIPDAGRVLSAVGVSGLSAVAELVAAALPALAPTSPSPTASIGDLPPASARRSVRDRATHFDHTSLEPDSGAGAVLHLTRSSTALLALAAATIAFLLLQTADERRRPGRAAATYSPHDELLEFE